MGHKPQGPTDPEEGAFVTSHRFSPGFTAVGAIASTLAGGAAPAAPSSCVIHLFSSRRGLSHRRAQSAASAAQRGQSASRAAKIGPLRSSVKRACLFVAILTASACSFAAAQPNAEAQPNSKTIKSSTTAHGVDGEFTPKLGTDGPRSSTVADGALDACFVAKSNQGPARSPGRKPEKKDIPERIDGDEREEISFVIESTVSWRAEALPPGATFIDGRFLWVPDFTQGGHSWTVHFHASDDSKSASTEIHVNDSVHPPLPEVIAERPLVPHIDSWSTAPASDDMELTVRQRTDRFLDARGYAGRTFEAKIVVPQPFEPGHRYPVELHLHGFNGRPMPRPSRGFIRIYPHDPQNTYWWGYASSLPYRRPMGTAPNYTQRRVLHLLKWVIDTFPADPDRVKVSGASMGGAGALALGLIYGRHFAVVESTIGQTIARNHRPSRIAQLSRLWGSPR
ncbi:MAG: alpha/beta hydrolase-fold protein, partial [Myxococcota bacterium]